MTTVLKRKHLNKKLLAYTTAASLALGTGIAQAANVLIDVDPDEVIDASGFILDTHDIDFDQDGNPEYRLFQGNLNGGAHTGTIAGFASGTDSGLQIIGTTSPFRYATALSLGDPINASSSWITMPGAGNPYINYGTSNTFPGAGDRYIGVRFQLDGSSFYYGWIEIEVDAAGDTITLKRYFYDDTQDLTLFAGQNPTSVNLQEISAQTTASLPTGGIAFATAALAGLSGLVAWLRQRWSGPN